MQKEDSILEPLDPDTVENINAIHKKNLLDQGYLPYRYPDGRIKWLNYEQHSYKIMKHIKVNHIQNLFGAAPASTSRRRRKHRPVIFRFIEANIWFILIMLFVIIAVAVFLKYSYLIMQ